jgi:hypothetical protein
VWLRLYDASTGAPKGELEPGPATLKNLTYSPDGKSLAATTEDGKTVLVWRLPGPKPAVKLNRPRAVTALALHPDGRRAAVGDGDGNLALVDLESGAELQAFAMKDAMAKMLEKGKGSITAAQFSPSGRYLAAVGGGIIVMRVDLAASGSNNIEMTAVPNIKVARTRFSVDERYLLGVAHDLSVKISLGNGKNSVDVTRMAGGLLVVDLQTGKSGLARVNGAMFEDGFFSADGRDIVVFAAALPFDDGLRQRLLVLDRGTIEERNLLGTPKVAYELGKGPAFGESVFCPESGTAWIKGKDLLQAFTVAGVSAGQPAASPVSGSEKPNPPPAPVAEPAAKPPEAKAKESDEPLQVGGTDKPARTAKIGERVGLGTKGLQVKARLETLPASAAQAAGLELRLEFSNQASDPVENQIFVASDPAKSQLSVRRSDGSRTSPRALKVEGWDTEYRAVDSPQGIMLGGCNDSSGAVRLKEGGIARLIMLCTKKGETDVVRFAFPADAAGGDFELQCQACGGAIRLQTGRKR